MVRYNVSEYTRSIRGPFEHGPSEATNQRGNKITKQTQFRRTQRESMVYSLFPVRWGGRIRPAPSGAATISAHGFSRGKKEQFGGSLEWATQGTASRNRPRQEQLVARTWRCSSVRVRGQLPSNRITKQTQFLIKPCFPGTYGKFGGLIVSFDRQLVRNAD